MTRAKGKAQAKQITTCAYCSKEAVPVRCIACAPATGGGLHHHGMAHINSVLKPLCADHGEKQRELAVKGEIAVKRNFREEAYNTLKAAGWFEMHQARNNQGTDFSVGGKHGEHKHLSLVVYEHGWEVFAGFDGAMHDADMDDFIESKREPMKYELENALRDTMASYEVDRNNKMSGAAFMLINGAMDAVRAKVDRVLKRHGYKIDTGKLVKL